MLQNWLAGPFDNQYRKYLKTTGGVIPKW